jgi:hypothetical protein
MHNPGNHYSLEYFSQHIGFFTMRKVSMKLYRILVIALFAGIIVACNSAPATQTSTGGLPADAPLKSEEEMQIIPSCLHVLCRPSGTPFSR